MLIHFETKWHIADFLSVSPFPFEPVDAERPSTKCFWPPDGTKDYSYLPN